MKKLILLAIFAVTTGVVSAQSDYSQAIGLRVSPLSDYDVVAVSFKTFLSKAGAIELNAGAGTNRVPGWGGIVNQNRSTALSLTGAYQYYFPIPVEGLRWYAGGGLSLINTFSKTKELRGVSVGVFPTGGIDYKFEKLPLNVSADYRPTIIVTKPERGWRNFLGEQFGISARYTF